MFEQVAGMLIKCHEVILNEFICKETYTSSIRRVWYICASADAGYAAMLSLIMNFENDIYSIIINCTTYIHVNFKYFWYILHNNINIKYEFIYIPLLFLCTTCNRVLFKSTRSDLTSLLHTIIKDNILQALIELLQNYTAHNYQHLWMSSLV